MQLHPSLQTPYFPLLPIPLLLSSLSSASDEIFLRCLSSDAATDSFPGYDHEIRAPSQLQAFPVGDALCNFLSAVLPQPIAVRIGNSSVDALCIGAGSANNGVQVSEENVDNATGAKDINWIDIVQFEVPELDQFSEVAWEVEKKRAEILSNVSVFDENLEMTLLAASDPHLPEVQRCVYSIEDVPSNSILNVKINISEDNDISLRRNHLNEALFPQLELGEITRGTFNVISLDNELQTLFANTEKLNNTDKDDDEVNWRELLNSVEIEKISEQISSELFIEPLMAHPNFFLEFGHYNAEPPCTEVETGIHFADSDCLVELVPFEEFKMLDPEYFENFDAFTIPQITPAQEKCDKLTLEGLSFKNFDQLIVCHEISMIDHNFKSFPVPIRPDDEMVQPLYAIITVLLDGLELLPVSASDEIYLDWDLLGKDNGSCDIHATFQRMFSDIGMLRLGYDIQSTEDRGLVLDFILSDDNWDESTTESKMSISSGGNTTVCGPLSGVLADKMLDEDHSRVEGSQNKSADLVSLRAESVPQFNELDYFLNPRNDITGVQSDVQPEKLDIKFGLPAGGCYDRELPSLCTRLHMDKWDIRLHVVHLSATMLTLIQNFVESFITVTEDLHLNSSQFSFLNVDGMLSLPEEKLMECMKILCKDKTFSGHINAITSAFFALLAIKRMAWCLCFFGIHCLHEFVDKMLQEVECLRSRLGLLIPYIEEAYTSANKEITKLHPSLDLIQEILKARTSQRSKILIVAEQKLWRPLKSLLVSMNVAVSEVTSMMHGSFPDASDFHKGTQSRSKVVQSDCLLATHMDISASILLKQFDIILEYGGLHSSSRVTSTLPKPTYSLNFHFLKVELDGAAKALCTGVNIPSSSMKLEELLNFVSMVEDCKSMSMDIIGHKMYGNMPLPINCMPLDSKSDNADPSSCPHTTIIVNTQDFSTEMIISQRSTYQRIVAMEKEGVQVLERDFCLPVDVIISAGMCLAWYNCKNIGKKATAPDEAASSVPLCVDNLAANVLTSLSFTFGSCVMVFEGEQNFIATITESFDELYAAAASLGIELQIFCSYSPELTEEIVLNCIMDAMKFHKGIFPKLSESETIAESFLMKFPSINPLSALALLSTGDTLIDFFGWSENCRIRALHKYHVPEESVVLLSILSRYGKREESVSGMTDCSSSLSSAPNSERLECKFSFDKRKREFNECSFDTVNVDGFYKSTTSRLPQTSAEPPVVDAFYKDLRSDGIEKRKREFNGSSFDSLNVDKLYKPTTTRLLKMSTEPTLNVEAFYEELRSDGAERIKREFNGSSFDSLDVDKVYKPTTSSLLKTSTEPALNVEAFYEELRSDDAEKMNPTTDSEPQTFWSSEHPNLMDDIPEAILPSSSRFLGHKKKSARISSIRLPWQDADIFKGLSDESMGEVVDFNNDPLFGANSSSAKKGANFFLPKHETEEAHGIKTSRAIRRLSFDHATHPNYPSLSSQETAFNIYGLDQKKEEPSGGGNAEKPGTYLHRLLNKDKASSGYAGTPLRKSIYSNELEGASPWTKEFLNQVREKMRLHKQYLKSDTSTPRADFCAATASKTTKRKSPSVLELFKYQGGKTPTKSGRRVRQKQCTQPSNLSKNQSNSMLPHTWTPLDKRATKTLSYETCGNGGQTKLVWSDRRSSPSPAKRFRR